MLPEQQQLIELEDRFILGELLQSDYLMQKRDLVIQIREAGETVADANIKVAEIIDSRNVSFCLIPPGGFFFGPNDEWKELECPFYISKYPVTVREFREFLQNVDIGYTDEDYESFNLVSPDDDCPASHLSYNDAKEFCRWLRRETGEYYSLPHEVEWEKAARGTDARWYPWGNFAPTHEKACYQGDMQYGCTVPVFSFQQQNQSPYGLIDMVGNVWEWCLDTFDDDREPHILRGGSWCNDIDYSNALARTFSFPPTKRIDYGGLRLIHLPGDMLGEYRKAYSKRGVAQSLQVVGMTAETDDLGRTKKISFKSLGRALDDAAAQALNERKIEPGNSPFDKTEKLDRDDVDQSSVNDAMAMAISQAANNFLRKSTKDDAYTSDSNLELPSPDAIEMPVRRQKESKVESETVAEAAPLPTGMQRPQYKSIQQLRKERDTGGEEKKQPTMEFDEEKKINYEKAKPLEIPPILTLSAVITWFLLFGGILLAFSQRLSNL